MHGWPDKQLFDIAFLFMQHTQTQSNAQTGTHCAAV